MESHRIFYQCGRRVGLPGKARVGALLQAEAVHVVIAAGCREYDFLGGADQDKQQLALAGRSLVQCRISRSWWRERARWFFERGLDDLLPLRGRLVRAGHPAGQVQS